MASPVTTAAMLTTMHLLRASQAVSGIFGSISLVAWICVILPQLFANFKAQSADGLSMAFLIVWMMGDVTNLMGALLTHLAPTAVLLPSYFVLADIVLISQCAYYNSRNRRRALQHQQQQQQQQQSQSNRTDSEESPLLRRTSSTGPHAKSTEQTTREAKLSWVNNIFSLAAVWVIGSIGWFISYKAGAWDSNGGGSAPDAPAQPENTWEVVGLSLGYVSAVCYLCARVPQILKNHREKSCEGLAVLFFMLSLTGNLTYGISILSYSRERKYLINALPFLIGSFGTMAEDGIIFVQFHLYSKNDRPDTTCLEQN